VTRRRGRKHHPLAILALALIAAMFGLVVLHVLAWLAVTAVVGVGAYHLGQRSRPVAKVTTPRSTPASPAGNARSLAQLNRHLNDKLDATQAKLEAEMARADAARPGRPS
jgi:hypothetical protein